MTSRDLFIVGGDGPSTISGVRILACEQCGRPANFSPSSLNHPEAKTATFICMKCAEKDAEQSEGFEVVPPTAEQLKEIREATRAKP